MSTVAFHTLGCKVNQYDTQAMLELFVDAGWQVVPFQEAADVYVLNTCTVTGTGDRKSLQMARRVLREHPGSRLILCGCLAQRMGEGLLDTGASVILGTQHRLRVVELLAQSIREGHPICAVNELNAGTPFEELRISDQADHTRAILKLQEGCNNHCTYCIIPSVRGPIRSRPLENVRVEAKRLSEAGFREAVLTGIHLTSYGRDLRDGTTLQDAIRVLQETEGIERIRLGSLEPNVATREFARTLKGMDKVCPQFHLALQSGSDTVLARMKRQYNTAMYRRSAESLREAFPDCALTTDVLTGFPGETEEELRETEAFIREMGYARIHVFPYSRREGTPADLMPGQLSAGEKERRARLLIAVGEETSRAYRERWLGRQAQVLVEDLHGGLFSGYTPEYIHVTVSDCPRLRSGETVTVRLTGLTKDGMTGEPV